MYYTSLQKHFAPKFVTKNQIDTKWLNRSHDDVHPSHKSQNPLTVTGHDGDLVTQNLLRLKPSFDAEVTKKRCLYKKIKFIYSLCKKTNCWFWFNLTRFIWFHWVPKLMTFPAGFQVKILLGDYYLIRHSMKRYTAFMFNLCSKFKIYHMIWCFVIYIVLYTYDVIIMLLWILRGR